MSRRILLVSYHFPPSAAVGGQRTTNFAIHLSALGWEPAVLTIRDADVSQLDRARLKAVEGLTIYKARVLPTVLELVTRLSDTLRRRRARRHLGRQGASALPPSAATPATETVPHRTRRWMMSFISLPDYERGWILPASIGAVRLIRQRRFNWMLTSCPPYSVHLVGLAAKMVTGVRWAADYRDPWMTTGSKRLFPTSAWSMKIERWLERCVIHHADLVLFNVERLRDAYRAAYPDVESSRFVFIPNAITMQDEAKPVRKFDAFTITYTGALYVGRSPEPVFQACSRLISQGVVSRDRLRIKLIGHCHIINGTPAVDLIRTHGLESVVEVSGPVSQTEALRAVQQSHLALLLAPGLPYQIPAKVYDYLSVGTRVLAIAEEGATADLVAQTGCGEAFAGSDVEGIERFIRSEISRVSDPHSNGTLRESLARFDRGTITRELVGHFGRVDSALMGAAR